ncbi:glycoside hydrolase family 25 protein [Intestinibacter bartlettii]|uniref:Glycoside hydrolase family 25 protein n=1 Tax=Intestinibacter bartlettii TaxID=261299 RepID=A0ABS6DZ11_9FIRM|nr:glycoside hydrolase family 25 protein [Intestinibacter bartlettii]MBU5336633.1 glycoside hydrolase family 25 protein [Intestinibacter bartlettii]
MAIKVWGIDVSKYNAPIDWQKVKNSGVKFAILRIGFASTSNRNNLSLDPYFETFYKGAKAVKMPVGAYFYSRCNSVETAKKEAQFILNAIKGKQFEYPIWLDVEDQKTLQSTNKSTMTRAVVTCLEEIKKAGYYVGIYSGKYILRDNLNDNELKNYDHWIAQYASRSTYTTYEIAMWQFGADVNYLTNKRVSGVSSSMVDQNYCYKDYPTIIKKAGLNGFKSNDTTKIDNSESDKSKTEDNSKDKHQINTTNYIKVKAPSYIKTLTRVNIRKSPSINSAVIYTAPRSAVYKITSISPNGNWGYIPYRKGWMTLNKKYVQKV